jgi:hypothetical protein
VFVFICVCVGVGSVSVHVHDATGTEGDATPSPATIASALVRVSALHALQLLPQSDNASVSALRVGAVTRVAVLGLDDHAHVSGDVSVIM